MRATAHRTALDLHLAACLGWAEGAARQELTPARVQVSAALAQAHAAAVVALAAYTPEPDPPECTACGGSGTVILARPPTDAEKVGLPLGQVPTSTETCQRCEGTGEDPT